MATGASGSGSLNAMKAGDIVPFLLRLDPRDVALVKFVIESYEGVGIVRTIDRKAAIIVVLAVPDALAHVHAILESLRHLIEWQEVAAPVEPQDWLLPEES
jgi:hypothetical protein